MGHFARWLLQDEQKEFFDYLFALVLNAVFLLLIALLLWPLGRAGMTWRLAKAYWIFWTVVIVVACLVALAHRIFRMDLYSHANAYVITGLVSGGFLQVGWSAVVAPIISDSLSGASVWVAIVLFAIGLVSCWVAAVIVAAFYRGSLYRMVNLALALASFVLFSVWPKAGSAIYGWLFERFSW
jgi:uncharacterized membrane protein